MAWFSACIFMKGSHQVHLENKPLWEQCIYLINSEIEEIARTEAEKIGKSLEHEYEVLDGPKDDEKGILKWTFEAVSIQDIEMETLSSGIEVYSTFLSEESVKNIMDPFQSKEEN